MILQLSRTVTRSRKGRRVRNGLEVIHETSKRASETRAEWPSVISTIPRAVLLFSSGAAPGLSSLQGALTLIRAVLPLVVLERREVVRGRGDGARHRRITS